MQTTAARLSAKTATVIALLLCGLCRAASPTPEQVAAMFKEGNAQRAARILETKRAIAEAQEVLAYARQGKYMRKDLRIGGLYFESDMYADYKSDVERKAAVDSWEDTVATLHSRLKVLEDRSKPLVPEIRDFLDIGKLGTLPRGATVRTRQGNKQALVAVTLPRSQPAAGQTMRDVLAYVKGVDCSPEAVIFGRIDLPGSFMVTGMSKAGGTEEFVLEPVDLSQYVSAEKDRAEKAAAVASQPSKTMTQKSKPAKKPLARGKQQVTPVPFMPDGFTTP